MDLLDLPADLRNIIYEFALVEADFILITPDLKQPALLATCRQVRAEARLMWFWRNTFVYIAQDCNIRPLFAFHALYGSPLPIQVNVAVYAQGQHNWKALKEWCKLVFKHKRHCFRCSGRTQGFQVLRAATVMAKRSRALTWGDFEQDLELWRPVAALSHEEWSVDY